MPNPVGRPLLFKTAEELDIKINAYFESCFVDDWEERTLRDENGVPVLDEISDYKVEYLKIKKCIKPPTITGLAVFLDTNRRTLLDYTERDEFVPSLEKAKSFCEDYVNTMSLKGDLNPLMSKMNLTNNYKWSDEKSIKHSGSLIIDPELKKKSDEAIDLFLNKGNGSTVDQRNS